jgi:hypothetical protein
MKNLFPKSVWYTAVHERVLRIWAALSTHLSNWIEAYFWLPIVMGGALFFNEFVKRADPLSGSDGLGALTGYAMLGVKGVLIMIFTWILKQGMFNVLARRHIRDLQDRSMAYDDQEVGAKFLLKMDRFEWVICLVVACFVFSA